MVLYGTENLVNRKQAYGLLALAVRETWGWESLPPMEPGEHGKPFFKQENREFNLSHSGSLALCALDEKPAGVDIQTVRSFRPGLPEHVFSDAELAWMGSGEDRWERFTLLWTLKESRVKCTGEGLTRRISGIHIPLPKLDDMGPAGSLDSTLYEDGGFLFRIFLGRGWCASVCGISEPPEEILWRSGPFPDR